MVGHRVVPPYELVDELAESHTVTHQTKAPNAIPTTSRNTHVRPVARLLVLWQARSGHTVC